VKKPARWNKREPWDPDKERNGTVTHFSPTNKYLRNEARVYFETDNGTNTWRALTNVIVLSRP